MSWTQYKHCHQGEKLTPITRTEFKAFLQKNLGKSKLFIDSIWRKLKQDFQYQLKEVYDWTFHLEHLWSILIKFDPAATFTESTMIRYFEKSLKLSIKAKIDQDATQLDNYEELIAKVVKAEAKAYLQSSFYIQKTDI